MKYIEKHAMKFKRSWQEDQRLLNKEVLPLWGKRRAEAIKKRDLTLLLEKIVDRGSPAMSNQVLKIVRKMFNFAVERDILPHTPFAKFKALAPNNQRNRALSETEIKTFWGTIENSNISDEIRRALKLVLVTAPRPGEVSGMHTKEIDGRHWIIPAERAKNRRTHLVYLTDTALDIIAESIAHVKKTRELPAGQEYSGYIFPCPHKNKIKPIDSHALPVAVRRNLNWPLKDPKGKPLFQKDGKPATENLLGIDVFTPHDLRRTATTLMAASKVIREHRERVLNHAQEKLDGIYNLYDYLSEKQVALERLESKLKVILAGNKVIDLDQKRSERLAA